MRKGILTSLMIVMMLTASAAVAGTCFLETQGRDDEPRVFMSGSGSYMGVSVRDVTSDRVAELKLKEETGAEVVAVDQDAPAGKAGLKEKDVIASFNGQKVESAEQLRRMIHEVPAGRNVTLSVSRDGQLMNVQVTLGARRPAAKIGKAKNNAFPPMPPMAPMVGDIDIPSFNVMVQTSTRSGIMVENLTPQLADFFGVKSDARGVLVRSVEKGSAAEAAGLRAGDVIVRVDKEKIADVGDWRRAIRTRTGATPLGIVRDKRDQTISVVFPVRKMRGALFNADDFDIDFDDIKLQLERLGPQIERESKRIAMLVNDDVMRNVDVSKTLKQVRAATEKAMAARQKDIEKAQKEVERAHEQMRKAFEQQMQ
ncbi:MAG TPA: PDZ domain-containing protein [Clostridia bacterium]|nr:PDZ domain-containing protein [Clostridia bacterium]